MMYYEFKTTTHGKWVLAGEHAVLRGHGAIAFPIPEKKLTLTYEPTSSNLKADFEGDGSNELHLLFWSVLEHGQHLRGQSLNQLAGYFHLHSNIPIGVGLGASAALCVAISRWFAKQLLIQNDYIFYFARDLENLFHGKSSGLDIAAVAARNGIYFKQGTIQPLLPAWKPEWYLSSSGQIGITSHCIQQVNAIWNKDEQTAASIDKKMQDSVEMALKALETKDSTSLGALVQAIEEGALCFKSWGLINSTLSEHIHLLKQHGALAVKPTGSGSGGYVLSLWDKNPTTLPIEIIRL